ncbi:hypothetical protein MSEDJ_02230 [Mycolicibacterium sediminis]|uniref:Uncharacterized protein n=1 Tax=Mycolicibacterium sediminis TaxID=1286180 RepID=A0A7I7QJ73_9MYCO|nr:hypothetical protein MSEDJ_02230 [Mycolicibacterium sediminis]
MEVVGVALDRAAGARHDGGTLIGEDGTDAGTDAPHPAGDENDPSGESEIDSSGVGHCASVPSKCLLR